MTHKIDLDRAVREHIITAEQSKALAELAQYDVTQARSMPDDQALSGPLSDRPIATNGDTFRLIGGFNDLFVTIGVVLVLVGTIFAAEALTSNLDWARHLFMACLIWAMAEYISRIRRMKLPSTALAIAFVLSVSSLLRVVLENRFEFSQPDNPIAALVLLDQLQTAGLIAFTVHLGLAALYFWRFRVPIQAAIIALAATGLVTIGVSEFFMDEVARGQVRVTSLSDVLELIEQVLILPLLCGLAIFAVGVWLDVKDRERTTTLSDAAFWLHLLSAPMIVHPLFVLATGRDLGFGALPPGAWAGFVLLALILTFVLISLAIDRRSLLVPTLGYFGALGIAEMISSAADSTGIPPFALILLVIGTLIMVFGIGWQRIRALAIGKTLPKSWLATLPPIKV